MTARALCVQPRALAPSSGWTCRVRVQSEWMRFDWPFARQRCLAPKGHDPRTEPHIFDGGFLWDGTYRTERRPDGLWRICRDPGRGPHWFDETHLVDEYVQQPSQLRLLF